MIAGVADTHTALWYLLRNPLLSPPACNFIDSAAAAGNDILLSPISLAGIIYPTGKNRVSLSAYEELKIALANAVPDRPDDIVAAAAVHFGMPVIGRHEYLLCRRFGRRCRL